MRPRRLELRNFLSYGRVSPLSFDGFHVVCLSGPNGYGKSALLDAITWALWGKSRARSDDDLIRHGCTEMLVDFEFDLEGQRYRVRRERVRRTSRGRTRLDFFVWDSSREEWRPLTESTLRDTQARIVETLKLDYDTFITSAYLRQGQADRFATLPPAQRKEILANILRLDQYARWEEKAKERARAVETQLQALAHQMALAREEIAKEADVQAELRRVEAHLNELESRLELAQQKERALHAQLLRLREAQEEHKRQQARVQTLADEVKTLRAKAAALKAQRNELQALLAQREGIEARYREYRRLKEEDATWNEKLRRHVTLEGKRRSLEQAYEKARREVERRLSSLEQEMTTLRNELEHEAQETQRLHEAEQQLALLDALEQDLQARQEELTALHERRATLRAELSRLRQEMADLKERLDRLEAAQDKANCPLCGQPLTAEHVQELAEAIREEGRAKKADYTQRREALQRVEQEIQAGQRVVQELERRLRERSRWQRQHATAEAALKRIQAARERLTEVEQAWARLRQTLEDGAFATDLRAQLEAVEAELQALGYDPEAHEQVRAQLAELADVEEQYRGLERAADQLVQLDEQLAQTERDVERWSQQLRAEEEALKEKAAHVRELPDVEHAWRQAAAEVERLHATVSQVRTEVGGLRQQLEAIKTQKERLQAWENQRKALEQERLIYRELAEAFGKRGLQAMIIEAALPELEEEANRLLARMTDGRMSVRLRTQREKASGEGVIETLDIEIADDLGARPFEMFSGGEAFRVSFALRIALSKLLARRAGARLRSLFIDEGFGSQDADGRLRLVDAINAIQDEFDLIVVITHIEELKEMFPARVEVFKGPQGSYFTLT